MPRVRRTQRPDPDQVYVAWTSGAAAGPDGTDIIFRQGERLRGDSPAVQTVPWAFVPDGTPLAEQPNMFAQLVERADAERGPAEYEIVLVHEPQPLEREDTLVLKRAVTVGIGAGKDKRVTTFEKGAVFNARSEFAASLPDAFEPGGPQFTRVKGDT
jgi:hypothetical protein